MTTPNQTNYVLMKSELRRSYTHMNGYKSDVVILSGTLIKALDFILKYVLIKTKRCIFYVDRFLSIFRLVTGLDAGDRIALFTRFQGTGETPCQYDKEDHRFVLKGA